MKLPLILAPMAGVTDLPFRRMCRKFGATRCVTEMVSAKALFYNDKKSAELLASDESDSPLSVQIFGSEPEIMAQGAQKVCEIAHCDTVDINMGCPVRKIFGNGEGSALMKNPGLIFDIVSAVKKAVPDKKVTAKIRLGIDSNHLNAAECAKAIEDAGGDGITVHGRTREQQYAPPVDYAGIAKVKEAVKIPVIGNGDIVDGASAAKMLAETGCDGLMIGRGAMGNPFIFSEIQHHLDGAFFEKPTTEMRVSCAKEQLKELLELKGEYVGSREARSQLGWYLKGMRGAAALRVKAGQVCNLKEIEDILNTVLKGG